MPDYDVRASQQAFNAARAPLTAGATYEQSGVGTATVLAPPDTVPPVVSNYVPAAGTAIATNATLQFDVTSNNGFCKIMTTVFFAATGQWEVAHTGDQYTPLYTGSSTRVSITDGFRYTLLRAGGWPSAPSVYTFAVDPDGNEST